MKIIPNFKSTSAIPPPLAFTAVSSPTSEQTYIKAKLVPATAMLARTQPLFLIIGFLLAPGWASPSCSSPPTIQLSLGNCTIPSSDGKDVHSWGIRTAIDKIDDICLVPSTVVSNSFLTTQALCTGDDLKDAEGLILTDAQCHSRRGGFIPQSVSLQNASTDDLDAVNQNWKTLGNEITFAVQATFKFFDERVTMVVALITKGQQSTASHLGLASDSLLLKTLKDNGLIAARSFGLNVGSQSVEFPRRGSLVLGGYDQASFGSSAGFEFNIAKDKLQNRFCPLRVTVEGLILTGGNGTDRQPKTLISRGSDIDFCIEPYDNLFRLPGDKLNDTKDFFASVTHHSDPPVTPDKYQGNLANLEPGLVYPADAAKAFSGSMRVAIKGGLVVDIPVHEMQRPLRGLDGQGKPVLDPNYTEIQIYGHEAAGYAPVLGKAFLSQVYLFVDEERGIFKLAPQAPEVSTPVPVSSASCSALSPSEKGLIGVGSVLGALLIGLAAYALYRRFRTAPSTGQNEKEPAAQEGGGETPHTSPPSAPDRDDISIDISNMEGPDDDAESMSGIPSGASAGVVSSPSTGFPLVGSASPASDRTHPRDGFN